LQFTTYARLSKKNEMGMACGTHGRQEKIIQGDLREIVHLEDLGIDGRIILK
jgi:hypothetical protein